MMKPHFGEPDFSDRTLTLVRKKLAMAVRFDCGLIDAAVEFDGFFDEYLMRFKASVYAEQLPSHTETRTVYVPATWWQQLKYEKAGRWWLRPLVRRRPVRQKPITLTATWENLAAYPWMALRTPPPEYVGAAVRLTLPPTSTITGTDDGDDD